MKNRWRKWDPNILVQRKYFTKKMVEDEDGLHIFFISVEDDDDSKLRMEFPGMVYAYRSMEELSALETINQVVDEDGHWMAPEWTFFIVEESSYVDEVKSNSKGIYADYDLIHFAVMAGESLTEVITDMLPYVMEGWEDDGTFPSP